MEFVGEQISGGGMVSRVGICWYGDSHEAESLSTWNS